MVRYLVVSNLSVTYKEVPTKPYLSITREAPDPTHGLPNRNRDSTVTVDRDRDRDRDRDLDRHRGHDPRVAIAISCLQPVCNNSNGNGNGNGNDSDKDNDNDNASLSAGHKEAKAKANVEGKAAANDLPLQTDYFDTGDSSSQYESSPDVPTQVDSTRLVLVPYLAAPRGPALLVLLPSTLDLHLHFRLLHVFLLALAIPPISLLTSSLPHINLKSRPGHAGPKLLLLVAVPSYSQ